MVSGTTDTDQEDKIVPGAGTDIGRTVPVPASFTAPSVSTDIGNMVSGGAITDIDKILPNVGTNIDRTPSTPAGEAATDAGTGVVGAPPGLDALVPHPLQRPWSDGDEENMVVDAEAVEQVLELIKCECGFLRLHGHHVLGEADGKRCRATAAAAASVCIFVQGLPHTKRSKWHSPLLYSVAPLLQRSGRTAMVRGGNLFVSTANRAFVKIVFANARK